MIGSFNGMYLWDEKNKRVFDFFTGKPLAKMENSGRPIAENMAAGLVKGKTQMWWFDYNRDAIQIQSMKDERDFPEMDEKIVARSPMSLWNLSLEVHTGRIFKRLIGPFYILYVPLAGICIMLVLISGFFIWWMVYRKK